MVISVFLMMVFLNPCVYGISLQHDVHSYGGNSPAYKQMDMVPQGSLSAHLVARSIPAKGSCECLNWKKTFDQGFGTCYDLPGTCKILKSQNNSDCNIINVAVPWCYVSEGCEIGETSFAGRLPSGLLMSREGVKWKTCAFKEPLTVKLTQLLPSSESGLKFTNVHPELDVWSNATFHVDPKTHLKSSVIHDGTVYSNISESFISQMKLYESETFAGFNLPPMENYIRKWYKHRDNLNREPLKILFVSIGDGEELSWFKNLPEIMKDAHLFGCDISGPMLAFGMKQLLLRDVSMDLSHCDGQNLHYKDSVFDMVIHSGSIGAWPSPQQGLSEFYRVVKQGGLVGVLDENIQLDLASADPLEAFAFLQGMDKSQEVIHTPTEFIPDRATNVFAYNMDAFYYWLSFSKSS